MIFPGSFDIMDGFLFYSEYLTNMLAESESYLVFFILVGIPVEFMSKVLALFEGCVSDDKCILRDCGTLELLGFLGALLGSCWCCLGV